MNTYCNKGLTLVELLITLIILSISFSIAVPALDREVTNARQRELITTYNSAFSFARAQAVHTGRLVTICPLSSENRCIDDWTNPAAIFPDRNKDLSPDDDIIWKLIPPTPRYHIRSRTGGRGYLTFNPSGLIHGASGSLVACPTQNSNQPMTVLTINRGGRFRAVHDHDRDNKIRLSWGALIQC